MTEQEIRDYYAKQVEWYKKQIAWNDREIEWLTRQMNMEREDWKDLKEFVWNKGPLTEIEMKIWGGSKCDTVELRKYKSQRRTEYLRRKKNYARLAEYKALLANA